MTNENVKMKVELSCIEEKIIGKFKMEKRTTENNKDPEAVIIADGANFGKVNIFSKTKDVDKYLTGFRTSLTELLALKENTEAKISKYAKILTKFLEENKQEFKEIQLENLRYYLCRFNLKQKTAEDGKQTLYRNMNVGKKFQQHILLRMPLSNKSRQNEKINKLNGVIHSYVSYVVEEENGKLEKNGFRFIVLDVEKLIEKEESK